ncbi:uncharacterized protein LOC130728984 [Lotus japonicus]|uniref:uncharacterized protein LOC130728984 n=1 Tax=Lotus japonicus TaxID=34305 RepID=UPI00258E9A4F|nr:uncharacterized protein LOC130728984 [Lotus japonicus]
MAPKSPFHRVRLLPPPLEMAKPASIAPSPPSPPRFSTVAPFTKFRIQGRPGRKDFDAYVFGNHNAPGIVVLHDSLGVDDHVKNHALKISQLGNGFKVLIPDLYGDYEGEYNGVDTMKGVYSAILWLRANGSDKVGVTGFSKGAALAIYSSYFQPSVDAVVAFYGTPPCMLGIPVSCSGSFWRTG